MNKFLFMPTFWKLLEPNCRILGVRSLNNKKETISKDAPKKKVWENRVTLISPDNSISIMDLASAQSLSVRRDLKLVKIEDASAKTRRPVYKLMTNAEYHEEELQKRKEKKEERKNQGKGEKLLTISSRIGQHDLLTRIKNAAKWLDKKYEVRVVISADSDDPIKTCESIYSTIENNIRQHGKILQKRTKGNTVRFQIIPDSSKDSESEDKSASYGLDHDDTKKPSNEGPL